MQKSLKDLLNRVKDDDVVDSLMTFSLFDESILLCGRYKVKEIAR